MDRYLQALMIADADDGTGCEHTAPSAIHAQSCRGAMPLGPPLHFLHSRQHYTIRDMHAWSRPRVSSAAPSRRDRPEVARAPRPQRSALSAGIQAQHGPRQSPAETHVAAPAADSTRRALLVSAPTAAAVIGGLLDARPAEAIKEIDTPDRRRVQARKAYTIQTPGRG